MVYRLRSGVSATVHNLSLSCMCEGARPSGTVYCIYILDRNMNRTDHLVYIESHFSGYWANMYTYH